MNALFYIRIVSLRFPLVFFIIFLVGTCPVFGQVFPKEAVTEKDYHMWGTLYPGKISDKGNWVSYLMDYDEDPDTLFVQSTNGNKTFRFANAKDGSFIAEEKFACLSEAGNLELVSLPSGNSITVSNVESYSLGRDSHYIILHIISNGKKSLEIRDRSGNLLEIFNGVESYSLSNSTNEILCSQKDDNVNKLIIIKLHKEIKKTIITESSHIEYTHLIWHSRDESFAFLGTDTTTKSNAVFFYHTAKAQLHHFNLEDLNSFPEYEIRPGYASGLAITADAKKVLFTLRKKPQFAKNFSGVQQWNTTDAVIYPEKQMSGASEWNSMPLLWNPQTGTTPLRDKDKPFGFLNGTQEYSVTYNKNDGEPQYTMSLNYDYHVTDLKTGERKLLVANQSSALTQSSLSPNGKYWAYFNKGDWWLYEFKSGKHSNLTRGHKMNLINSEDPSWKSNYRVAGWGINDEYLLVYDGFDIWKFNFTQAPKRLTKGREKGISYEIVAPARSEFYVSSHRGHVDLPADLHKNILLRGKSENGTGYFILEPDGKIRKLVYDPNLNNDIVRAAKADVYVYISQHYGMPAQLKIIKGTAEKAKPLFQSNPQHFNFDWGKQETIHYKAATGAILQGLLYYPSAYDPLKKYPMVVHIYEKQSYMKNYYFNPSWYNTKGFNIANLTAKGYFVLLPDIEYEVGNPGKSAADCTIAATYKVIESGLVLKDKIALVGQSFGGYETNFIVTQTNMFAAAVSSASIFDLQSFYLSVGEISGTPEMWRMESQQWRMGSSLFENKKAYLENSPSTFVENIKTPMLIWTGEFDKHVNPNQSISLYLALRRMKQQAVLLMFPGDSHSLLNPDNQKELTRRLEDWLAYYLKEERPATWISASIQ